MQGKEVNMQGNSTGLTVPMDLSSDKPLTNARTDDDVSSPPKKIQISPSYKDEDKEKMTKERNKMLPFQRKVLFNWKLLKENIIPEEFIDLLRSAVLVDDWDLLHRNKHISRRSQIYSILSNAVKNIQTSVELANFEAIVAEHSPFIQLQSPIDPIVLVNNTERAEGHLRQNREKIEKEVYPKDNIDDFLKWSIFSLHDHEELRYVEDCRQHMAHSFLGKIMDPSYVEKGSIGQLIQCFLTDTNIVIQRFATLMMSGLPVGSNFIDDEDLKQLVWTRERCRNSILCNWSYLKEEFNPIDIIDDLLGVGLVDEDRADIINDEKVDRRKQIDSTLRNIVRRIDEPLKFSEFISILQRSKNEFIADQLQKEKTYDFREERPDLDVIDIQNLLKFYKNDVVKEFNSKDVDTFLEKHIFDVDDHEYICEVAKNEQDMARSFYKKISDEKCIRKGSFDCLVLCLKINKTHSILRQRLAECLSEHQKPEQVKTRTETAVWPTDPVRYERDISILTEGVLKITIDDEDIKDQVETEIVEVLESSEYKDKAIDGFKLIVKETIRSSVLVHLESNGRNVKFIVEKAIDNGDLTRFIDNILGNENIKMHLSPGKKYRVSVSLCSPNNILESLSETLSLKEDLDNPKLRIIKANREMLEEEYDSLPLLNAVIDGRVSKYKSLENLSQEYASIFRNQLSEIRKEPERRKRVQQFLDIAEDKIDADKLWEFIEDTGNAFSVKILKDDLHSLNSESKDKRYSAESSEKDTVFKGVYEVWITEKDVKSPLQSMILEERKKKDERIRLLEEEAKRRQEAEANRKRHELTIIQEKEARRQEEQTRHSGGGKNCCIN